LPGGILKITLQYIDVVLGTGLVDVPLGQRRTKAVGKRKRASFNSLKYEAGLTVGGTGRLSLRPRTYRDKGKCKYD
jgi:hypothetical protein